jgi:hypothetical protein
VWGHSYVSHGRVVSTAIDHRIAEKYGVPGPYRRVWYAKLLPGGFAIPHIDTGPFYDRWHIPIEPAGWFWEYGTYTQQPDTIFRVRHWLPHAVWNDEDIPRVHIMVDRNELAYPGTKELELFHGMVPEIETLMMRAVSEQEIDL